MRIRRLIAAVLIMLSAGMVLSAQDTASQESRKAALEREIAQLEGQINENNAKSANALNELTLIRKKVSTRKQLVSESDKELSQINDSIAVTKREAAKLQARVDTLTLYYHRLVRNAYKNRDARVWFMYLLASDDLGQAARRYAYLRDLSSQMNLEARKMKQLQADLSDKLSTLETLRAKAETIRNTRQKELDRLNMDEKRSNDLIVKLKKDKKTYQKSLDTKKRQVKALNDQISKIIAEYMAENSSSSKNSSGKKTTPSKPIDYKLAGQFAANRGKLPWPADGPVVEKFGNHRHPVYTNLEMPFNNGINIGLAKNAPVSAIFDGIVRRVIVMPGYNKCILIQHGNYFTFYCKMGQVDVKAGDNVKTGQKLGRVDTIDGQTQLHFQVWRDKTPENPEFWLRPRL